MSLTTWDSEPPHDPPGYWSSIGEQDAPIPSNGKDHAPEKPTITVAAGELDIIATQGESALIAAKFPIYQRGQSLVRPVLSEVPASRGRTTMAAGLANIGQAALIDRLCQAAQFERYDARMKKAKPIDPPANVAATILSRNGAWRFPRISGVITTPTLRPDGSLLTNPGYDIKTRLYHAADTSLDVRAHIPPSLSRDDAMKALGDLQYLLKNFPTVGEVDHSVALSFLITPVVRGALPVVPMHTFGATTAGTGKTYLVDVASAIATGRPCPVATVAKTEEETEKRLGGLLISAFPIICLDNVNGELGGDLLCQAIERPIVQIRPLGSSEIIEIESRASICATGNAIRVRGDMTRRSLMAFLDAGVERPELRDFDFDPVEEVLTNRGRYVGAALTIVLAYAKAGFPNQARPLASFQDWSRLVRSALLWLGCADPCDSMEKAREDDPELTDLTELLTAWRDELDTVGSFTVADLVEKIGERGQLDEHDMGPAPFRLPRMREILLRASGNRTIPDSRKIGNMLRNREGRIVKGLRVRRVGKYSGGVILWRVSEA